MGGMLGAEISFKNLPGNYSTDHAALFSESMGRILVSVDSKKAKQFESIIHKNMFGKIGTVTKINTLNVKNKKGKQLIQVRVSSLLDSYKQTFKDF